MSKIYSALVGLGLSVLALGAQSAHAQVAPKQYVRCGTQEANDEQQKLLMKLIPGYDPTPRATTSPSALRTTAVSYTLPVVVHIINNGENVGVGSNISQAQVQSQLDVLNEDYRKLNADGALTPAAFQPVRGDAQIQFVASRIDPNGATMAEPGIDRVNRNAKSWTAPPYTQAYIQSTIKPATSWDPSKYINIWVMNLGSGLLGYAQFPDNTAGLGGLSTSGGAANTDGVVILYTAYGSRAKAPSGAYINAYDLGRTLTHELGHWLGLRHITGDAACGNDYCADTPTQQALNSGCPTYPHITCNNAGDQSMNYMDYSNDVCLYMFSIDQVSRMQAVMVNTPRRTSLATSNVACPNTVAATAANSGPGCAGGTLNLTATGPAGATYSWVGPNGYTSTAQNPTLSGLTAAMAGTYTVTVSVTTGACPGVASTNVVVSSPPPTPTLATTAASLCAGASATLSVSNLAAAAALPSENFNGAATGWTIGSTGTAVTAWQYRAAPYNYSSTYLTLSNYSLDGTRFVLANSDAGGSGSTTNTTLTSPAFSTAGYGALQVSFQHYYSYASNDVAAVEASTDGTTWTAVATYTANQGTPTAPATATIDLGAYLNRPSVQLRWRYVSSWGNAWALDNVSFSGAAVTYAWSVVSGNGLPTATNTPSITVTPTQPSVYRLTVNYAGSSCTSTSTIAVSAVPAPVAPVVAASQSSLCGGSTSVLTATNLPTAAGTTYKWEQSTNGTTFTAIAGATAASYTAAPTVTTQYRLTVTNSCGVSASSNAVAVSLITNSVQAYPVPFGDTDLTIQVSTCTPVPAMSVRLFDSLGRRVYDQTMSVPAGDNKIVLPGSQNLSGGKYTLKVEQDGQITTFNIVHL